MKSIAVFLCLLIFSTYSANLPAFAQGNVQAKAPVNKVGTLLLGDATAFLSNDTLEVRSNGASSTNSPLLTGAILNSKSPDAHHIRGLVVFNGGSSFSSLCNCDGEATVDLEDGEEIKGRVVPVGGGQLSVQTANGETRRIDGRKVKRLVSPCAFEFSATIADLASASHITFSKCVAVHSVQKTAHSTPKQAKTAHDWSTGKKVVVIVILGCLIATAIAVPIAVGVATHHHHNNNADQQVALLNLIRARQAAARPAPVAAAAITDP